MICTDGTISCALLMAKSRVAPSKVISIPRLELTAAVIAVKMSLVIKRELEVTIQDEYFWTDSRVILGYISNDARRFHVFVSNRVQFIREHTKVEQWHYVPTKSNPADLASRGANVMELTNSCWFEGPHFLKERQLIFDDPLSAALALGDPEVKVQCLNTRSSFESTGLLERLNKFSEWTSMVSAISALRRKLIGKKAMNPSVLKNSFYIGYKLASILKI
jgi:hypothetical protein